MSKVLPEGRLVKIELEVCLPVAATMDEIEEWAEHEIGGFGGVSDTNPLLNNSPQAFGYRVMLTDTGMQGQEERFDHQPTEHGGVRYKVRYVRTAA